MRTDQSELRNASKVPPDRRIGYGLVAVILLTVAPTAVIIEIEYRLIQDFIAASYPYAEHPIPARIAKYLRAVGYENLVTLTVPAVLLGTLGGAVWNASRVSKTVSVCIILLLPVFSTGFQYNHFDHWKESVPRLVEYELSIVTRRQAR